MKNQSSPCIYKSFKLLKEFIGKTLTKNLTNDSLNLNIG